MTGTVQARDRARSTGKREVGEAEVREIEARLAEIQQDIQVRLLLLTQQDIEVRLLLLTQQDTQAWSHALAPPLPPPPALFLPSAE